MELRAFGAEDGGISSLVSVALRHAKLSIITLDRFVRCQLLSYGLISSTRLFHNRASELATISSSSGKSSSSENKFMSLESLLTQDQMQFACLIV
mmetsp:Transcript_4806/g.7460  ORF Transcript_4806/g.7460 Transcript_4806/m.7460 type:complete len:95 (+) Transcript_4806:77-361(+)